ncbi:hypothetical protein [Pedobacter rhizosphaerae]|uniref:Prepilin-type N-terminal cleavage/methylation domain-containing protein n=1 Tax=Pedobacter rhizosphaerae TaxID=390241 RepID=A0A1H9VFG3_9SPHI|nr:hypothetical protein [Pedobacter rhizosphaerae]SES20214.1 hypothetical protein SAMN04488023_14216 [Pedobacter rhizosphaerae]
MKIKAYTLLEVTIAMLLSAICISVCFTAYGLMNDYYSVFRKKNKATDTALTLKHVLDKDFLKARYVLKTPNGLSLQQDSLEISYQFDPHVVLRKFSDLPADSFPLDTQDLLCAFEQQDVVEADTIDLLQFKVAIGDGVKVPYQINKVYSAQDLLK